MTEEKQCRGCGVVKDLREFYVNPNMSDGRLNHCMVCVRLKNKMRARVKAKRLSAEQP